MQSKNYIPGVSGWKMHKDGRLEFGGVIRVVLSEGAQVPRPGPFVVIDGVTYIPKGEVRNAKMGLTVNARGGKYVAAGFNIGVADLEAAQIAKPKSVDQVLKEMAESLKPLFTVRAKAFENAQAERAASDHAIAARISAVEARLDNSVHLSEVIRQALEPGGLIQKAIRDAL